MNKKIFKLKLSVSFALIGMLLSSAASASTASGTLAMNLDANALASFNGGANTVGSRYLYVDEFYNQSFNNVAITSANSLSGGLASSTDLDFTVNGSSITSTPGTGRLLQATSLNYGSDPTTGTGQIGLSGAITVSSDIFSGYLLFSELSLKYTNGEWVLSTNQPIFGTQALFDLTNVLTSTNSAGLLSLTGNLVFDPAWGSFIGVNSSTVVGNVSLAPAAVPVPAALWLFGSGLASLFVGIRRNTKVTG
jgi:hypothetical protein